MVIGAGMAGMAATLFAANRQIDTVQVGVTGEINFASGLLDLLAVHPIPSGTLWDNPREAVRRLVREAPDHPYARLTMDRIESALEEFTSFLKKVGHPYYFHSGRNSQVLTAVGTAKTTYAVPLSMHNGSIAYKKRLPCLLVDFEGLKGFSGRQIAETMKRQWPALRHVSLGFPDVSGEAYTEHMARALETESIRAQLADAVRPYLKGVEMVGLPAILGIYRTRDIIAFLEDALGLPVFEIPGIPPSITGLRLREVFEDQLPHRGVRTFYQKRVLSAHIQKNGSFLFAVGGGEPEVRITADAVILATGRFFGKGLTADHREIREALFDLPVFQPDCRGQWHRRAFLNPGGHPINQCGLETDEQFRPLSLEKKPVHHHLYAAGSILAHQDWIRQKCGSGLAIATAHAAVAAFERATDNEIDASATG